MSDLSSFAQLMQSAAEEKRLRELAKKNRKVTEVAPLLSELFSTITKGKESKVAIATKESPLLVELQEALLDPDKFRSDRQDKKERILELVSDLESQAVEIQNKIPDSESTITKDTSTDIEKKFLKLFNRLQADFQTLKKYVENKQISNISYGGSAGSGEVRILRMDDINTSAIADGKLLKWDAIQKKFVFIDFPVAANLYRSTVEITADYTPTTDDYYVGVNSENSINITLPNSAINGKKYIIKDESGCAQLASIKIIGNIDNDPDGVELRTNNGSVSLIYRNGWRII